MTEVDPLPVLAMRAVANAASFTCGHKSAHLAIVESYRIITVLYYDTDRNELWRATEQLCQGTVTTAMETSPVPAGVGLDALMNAVEKANTSVGRLPAEIDHA